VLLKLIDNLQFNQIAPSIDKIGCILPYSAFYHLLFNHLDNPIIATSANIEGEPIIIDKNEIDKKLTYLDFVVDFNRDIVNANDDSVVQMINDEISILRLSRGYAPKEFKLPFCLDKKILAVGANQKNSIALAFNDKVVISPYIGDLDTIKSLETFDKTLNTFKKFYDFEPDIIIHDKHPNYENTKWAKKQNKELFAVQHHLAHLYSVKAEFDLDGDYLGFIFDGTGYGDDKKLWGGEVFVGDKRAYSFKSIQLIGGEIAIKEPKRVALSILFEKYSLEKVLNLPLKVINAFEQSEIRLLYQSWTKDINCPSSSSIGRYFDAVASLDGVCQVQSYEGEAGLLCESVYDINCYDGFDFTIDSGVIDIDFDFLDTYIVSKFINTLANIIIDISQKEKLPVILSGGVFQNRTLLELTCKQLQKYNIEHYYNKTTPINDSGIALGQIWKYIYK
jgi:hydrogenase maturation protein HypF